MTIAALLAKNDDRYQKSQFATYRKWTQKRQKRSTDAFRLAEMQQGATSQHAKKGGMHPEGGKAEGQ